MRGVLRENDRDAKVVSRYEAKLVKRTVITFPVIGSLFVILK